jgi:hypothetical protein
MNTVEESIRELGIKEEVAEDTNKRINSECEQSGITYYKNVENKNNKLEIDINNIDRDIAVREKLIPNEYRDAKYSVDKIRNNIRAMYSRDKRKTRKFEEYVSTCSGILSTIRMGNVPNRSYIIGAPNGFGKTSFVNEALITLRKYNKSVAPYVSLLELAHIRAEEEKRIMRPFRRFVDESGIAYTEPSEVSINKIPQEIVGAYSYTEYINAECLFVHLTDVISKDIESHTLYQLINIRGVKGLPTIVMMSTSIEPYFNDRILKELVWDEILAHSEEDGQFDRLYHVSTYRDRHVSVIDCESENIENDTGIIGA